MPTRKQLNSVFSRQTSVNSLFICTFAKKILRIIKYVISVENLKVEFGIEPLFDHVSFAVNDLDRIALVGKYGAQNEVYNDDWAENGLIVLCFS